jgi:adenosine deaminase
MEPLADLHRHLDGALRPETVRDLAAKKGLSVPTELAFVPGMGLAAALSRFEFTLSLLQDAAAVQRVASEMCGDAAVEGVTTLEIRFAPQLHRGAPLEAIIDAAVEGAAGRAGLILCGLYGEPPEVLARLVDAAAARPGVTGIDLAGAPHSGGYGMDDYARAFRRAAALGLGRTVHASEGRPPAEIATAIELLGAQRIGHGTTLLDDPRVAELVVARGVTIEVCATSNWHVGAIPAVAAHPLPEWLKLGVRACICTDNPLLSSTDAREEHRRIAALPGIDAAALAALVANGHAAAFAKR